MESQYYVYMLASRKDGAIYVGVTSDLIKRVYQHKEQTGSQHTTKYHIKKLVWYEIYGDVELAIHREKQLKKYRRQYKVNLIETENPEWNNLYPALFD